MGPAVKMLGFVSLIKYCKSKKVFKVKMKKVENQYQGIFLFKIW